MEILILKIPISPVMSHLGVLCMYFCDNKTVVVVKIAWHLQIRKLAAIGYKLRTLVRHKLQQKGENHKYIDRLSAKGKIRKKVENLTEFTFITPRGAELANY